jgi:two-component system OmpR family response regulator
VTSTDGVIVDLSGGEYDVLIAFVEHPNRILTREQLLDLARNRTPNALDRSIDVQISRIRRKLECDGTSPPLIKTVRGAGYIFLPAVKRC